MHSYFLITMYYLKQHHMVKTQHVNFSIANNLPTQHVENYVASASISIETNLKVRKCELQK